jgi:hypothetical protein
MLFNFEPPATDEEIRAASVQFVRKLSGFTKPSTAKEIAFAAAVDDIAAVAKRLLDMETQAPRKRERKRPRPAPVSALRFAR